MKRLLLVIAIILGVAAIVLRLYFFEVGAKAIPAFDDECKISLQAKQIARGQLPLLILGSPYVFPLEAYIQAPFINHLPRNAFGARVVDFAMGFITIILSLMIMKRWGPWRNTWPGVILILFPSSYLLMLQVGCALPGYPTLMMLASLVIWLALKHAEVKRFKWIFALLGGICGGLAASDTMLALPILVMGGAMIAVANNRQTAMISAPICGIGGLIGFAPHLAAKYMNHGAFDTVLQNVSFTKALKKIISPTLEKTLPSAFGWGPTIFPDHRERVPWIQGFDFYIGIILLLLLIFFTVVVTRKAVPRWRQERWPSVDASMAFAGIAWMCLVLFIASSRSHHHTYRYFIPFVLSFPFLIAYTYQQSGKATRWVLGILSLMIAGMNLTATAEIVQRWNTPGFSDYLKCYDLKPVFSYLEERGINRCYGTYTDVYRITYESDEKVICCQPLNERFPGWNIPFSDTVNQATNVAFVLSDSYRFKPNDFEAELNDMHTKYRKETCGHYKVYTDFEFPLEPAGKEVPPEKLTITTCHNTESAKALNDGNYGKRWQSFKLQEKGMWVEIELSEPHPVSQVKIYYNQYRHDRAKRMKLETYDGFKWTTLLENIPHKLDIFEFVNGHPSYMNEVHTLRFPAVTTTRLKLEITEPTEKRDWTMGEIRVFEAK